nr:prolyl oligopeptidase family serine peptidase [Shewanella waksmanii]
MKINHNKKTGKTLKPLSFATLAVVSASIFSPHLLASNITPQTVMQFESLKKPVISAEGNTLAVEVAPDRGDSHGLVKTLTSSQQFSVENASKPKVSRDGHFVAFERDTPLLTKETASAKEKKKLKAGMVLLDTKTGKETSYEQVKSFQFNDTGTHLAIWFEADQEKKTAKGSEDDNAENKDKAPKIDKFDKGSRFVLIDLANMQQQAFEHVTAFAFNRSGSHLALATNDIANQLHQLHLSDLKAGSTALVKAYTDQQIGHIAVSEDGLRVAHTFGAVEANPYGREYQLAIFYVSDNRWFTVVNSAEWTLNRYSEVSFSDDNKRLFFGRVPQVSQQLSLPEVKQAQDLTDSQVITGQRNLRIWHGDDPRIKPNEIEQYDKELKRTYLAVMHLASNNIVQLADQQVPDVQLEQQSRYLLASSDIPYRKMITWAGFYRDFYLIDINTGRKIAFLTQQPSSERPTLSPDERSVAYYQQGDLFLYQIAQDRRVNLTKSLKTQFSDEDHDYPSMPPSYGFGPWIADGSGFIAYDKYDVWQFNTESLQAFSLTAKQGRKQQIQYRVAGLYEDKEQPTRLAPEQAVLLHGYNERTKADGFYQVNLGVSGVSKLMAGEYKLTPLARAENSSEFVFSKQRYDLFPDLYVGDVSQPQKAVQQTNLDAQKEGLNWSHSELVTWANADGKPLDGVLIKPTNYQEGQRYPVLVYFYRIMSDRLHAFPQMKINHRPNFAWFSDNGYAVFLPDIRFEVGYPGPSSVQALNSGVQKLIDMGIADPDAIGIQGHSWGGYQTAFAVTQTHIFKAAVTGAPVSNMTSAYSGIRHGSGLARQFQYETGQSRIGESLFKSPHKYIENSPVFYAERIKTPMMIMFGDKDDAVPWEQGVEMYLAMRRAGKDVVFLQYQDEPHHLKKYPNKLDYSIRMMEYFDHYLKGKPAPQWLQQGEAYQEYKKAD